MRSTKLALFDWFKMPYADGSGYSWDWSDADFTFSAHSNGHLEVVDREEGVRKERKFATATQARSAAEQYYAERRPLAVLAREGESRKEERLAETTLASGEQEASCPSP